jgi:2-polyprenyl-6-methoxyphenol hydroxylase-like FAD-dependent oxidoreductase
MGDMQQPQVLVVGAGPTGLVLALWLHRLGVRVRIVDKVGEPGTTSRAIVMHARTLEFYRQLGLADEVVASGREFNAANLWVKGRRAGRVVVGAMGQGLSPYPFMLIYPQDEHERLLTARLAAEGVVVERPVAYLGHEERGGRVVARLQLADGSEETCEADYLAGCDGARSTVRDVLDVDFPGGTYEHVFYVADAEATGPVMNGELNIALDEADFLAVFPLRGERHGRFIGTVDERAMERQGDFTWDDVSKDVMRRLNVEVNRVNWFSTYHVHHRVAKRFQAGRAFLLGDAAHIHSPVGGQGMNTGIGDAVNLAWKLAAVVRDGSNAAILDTYEPERMAFARRLVATTDRAFTVVTSTGRMARFMRAVVAPRVLPALFRIARVRRFMFRTVSQIAINYRDSTLSQGAAGRLVAGDRLPWVPFDGAAGAPRDNFVPLESLAWQVHVYGTADPTLEGTCQRLGVPLHVFAWTGAAGRAGLRDGVAYVVRPDGYIALVDELGRGSALEEYFESRGIRASKLSNNYVRR